MPESSSFTNGNEVPLEQDALKESKHWEPTAEEMETLKWVVPRVEQELVPAQSVYHKEWDDAKEIFEAYITAEPNRPKFKIPISHTVIDAALSEEMDAFPDIEIDSQEDDDKPKLPVLNSAKKYALAVANWDKVKIDARRISRIYGFCPIRIYYARETRKIKERIPVQGEDGLYTVGYKDTFDYPKDDIMLEVIDNPRRFLIDDTVRDIDDAGDCALITEMSWSAFKQKVQHDKRYKNVKYVSPGGYYNLNIATGEVNIPEADTPTSTKKVKVLEYWNKHEFRYVMMANGVIIRDVPLVDDHGELPFAVIHMYRRPHVFYSKGIPKILESVEAAYNAIIAAEVQATKLAFPILVTREDSGIDPRSIAPYPGIVLEGAYEKMKLEQLGQVPQEAYRLKEKLEQWAIWITGINFQQVFSDKTSDRVGIEALKKESMLSRVNSNLRENESNFIVRIGNLLIQDIMQYYSGPRVRKLMSTEDLSYLSTLNFEEHGKSLLKDDKGEVRGVLERRRIPVMGVKMEEKYDTDTSKLSLTAKRDEGTHYILARPEYIRTKMKVDVRAVRPSAMGSSKEAKKLMSMELSNHAMDVNAMMTKMPMGTNSDGTPIMGKPIWDQEYLEKMVAEVNELKVEKAILSEGDQGKQREAQAELEKVAGPLMKTFEKPVSFQVEEQKGPMESMPAEQKASFDFNSQG